MKAFSTGTEGAPVGRANAVAQTRISKRSEVSAGTNSVRSGDGTYVSHGECAAIDAKLQLGIPFGLQNQFIGFELEKSVERCAVVKFDMTAMADGQSIGASEGVED